MSAARSVASEKFRALSDPVADQALILGVSQATISMWRRGRTRPPEAQRAKIEAEWPAIPAEEWLVALTPRAVEPRPELRADSIEGAVDQMLETANRLNQFLREDLEAARQEPDVGTRTKLSREIMTTMTQLSKITGEARDLTESQLVRMPAFRRVLDRLRVAVAPWPDAQRAIGEALTDDG